MGLGKNIATASTIRITTWSLHSRKSVVVSNIDKGIIADYLPKYLSKELCIDESDIRVTLLKPARIADADIKFLQFRISVPSSVYDAVKTPDNWPDGIRIRDYVFHHHADRKLVLKEFFLLKKKIVIKMLRVDSINNRRNRRC